MEENNLSLKEIKTLKKLLKKLSGLPNIPQELFVPVMGKNVPVTIELVIICGNKILLTPRNDAYYKGWHFPGSFLCPGETFKDACKRTALKETNLKIQKSELISVINVPESKRFHYASLIFICSTRGEPSEGEWFTKCPKNIIPQHKKIWLISNRYLKK